MTKALALIVDDEPDIRELLEITLARMDIGTRPAADLQQAREQLRDVSFDLCLTDMRLPDGSGIDLVRYIQKNHGRTPVAVITAHGNMELAVEALKAGAFDFVSKPVDLEMLRKLVNSALGLARKHPERRSREVLLGDSPSMQATRRLISKLARSQAPVYISGESGTGKELAARQIHALGPRADKPFVPVNCGAIPSELMESEFFGHVKGSFTGAHADKAGLFREADGGTLFLDEVADLPLPMQVKLLRAIQEKAIRPVGAARELPVDVRILSATHKDLKLLVDEGLFRQDLYYRINVIRLSMPSLRERREDIPVLANHILERMTAQNGMPPLHLAEDGIAALQAYGFPGNVRELENILERAAALCEDQAIHAGDLQLPRADPPERPASDDKPALEEQLHQVEREAIIKALEQTRYNKTAAARLLGMTFRQLRYRLKKLGID